MEEELKRIIKQAVKEVIEEMNFNQFNMKEILSVKELSEWLGVSAAWISVNKDKLSIPYFKCGGDKFYRSDIEKWIEENKREITTLKSISTKKNIKPYKAKLKVY